MALCFWPAIFSAWQKQRSQTDPFQNPVPMSRHRAEALAILPFHSFVPGFKLCGNSWIGPQIPFGRARIVSATLEPEITLDWLKAPHQRIHGTKGARKFRGLPHMGLNCAQGCRIHFLARPSLEVWLGRHVRPRCQCGSKPARRPPIHVR
jgi:hypothetical protein